MAVYCCNGRLLYSVKCLLRIRIYRALALCGMLRYRAAVPCFGAARHFRGCDSTGGFTVFRQLYRHAELRRFVLARFAVLGSRVCRLACLRRYDGGFTVFRCLASLRRCLSVNRKPSDSAKCGGTQRSGTPCAAHSARIAGSHTDDCTSPIWHLRRKNMQILDCPMPPPMV